MRYRMTLHGGHASLPVARRGKLDVHHLVARDTSMSQVRIASIEALHLRLPEVEEKADGSQEVLLARVITDTGLVGYDEAVSNSTVARAIIEAPRSAPFRHGLGVALIGADPLDPPSRWLDMYNASRWYGRRGATVHAMAAIIDTALWDLVGQHQAKPCHAIWGTRRQHFRAYASVLFLDTPKQAAALASSLAARGFSAIKLGWGQFGQDRDWDCAVLGEVRAAIGSNIDLMVDAGRIWRAEEAIERAPELFERFGLLWLEEPLHEDDLDGYGRLAGSLTQARIATGETEEREKDFSALLDSGVRVIQPDVGRAGGLTVCLRLSTLAHRRGAWCVPHCFGTGVNLAASAQWMASAEEAPFMEYPVTHSPLRNDLVTGLPRMVDGMVEFERPARPRHPARPAYDRPFSRRLRQSMIDISGIESSFVDDLTKGMPGGLAPIALSEIGRQNWNVLREDLPLPLAVLHERALAHNSDWMRRFLAETGAFIAPHGKTTMSPQLFRRQLDDGAWGITIGSVQQLQAIRHAGVSRVVLANQLVGARATAYVLEALRRDPAFDFFALANSPVGVERLAAAARTASIGRPLQLLVEGGIAGGRTGARDLATALAVAGAIKASEPHLALRGVEGFEGLVQGANEADTTLRVRSFLDFLADIAVACAGEHLFAPGPVILTAGGSSFYDLVVSRFRSAGLPHDCMALTRSGCYLTHNFRSVS